MALENAKLMCVGKLDAKRALELSQISPQELAHCNIVDLGSWLSKFWELIALESQGCDIYLIDRIYRDKEVFVDAVTYALETYRKDLLDLDTKVPESQRNNIFFDMAKKEIERRINLVLERGDVWKFVDRVWEVQESGNDNMIHIYPELPQEVLWTIHYVFMTSLFYNIQDPSAFLEEVDSYLADDGKIILIEPRNTYTDGGKFNVDSMLEFLRKIWQEGQKKLWIRIINETDEIFSVIEIQKGAYNRVKFPKNK